MIYGGERFAALEHALLEDPDDHDAWAVYADWLTDAGDARGELISLELQIEAAALAGRAPRPSLVSRYAALASDGPRRWPGEELTSLLADPDASRHLAIEWRRGAPYRLRLRAASLALARARLATLSAGSALRFSTGLELVFTATRDEADALVLSESLSEPLASLRTLDLDGWTFTRARPPLVDLRARRGDAALARLLPRLDTLRLRCPKVELGALAHPRLRALLLSSRRGFDPSLLEALAAARLPALAALELHLGAFGDHPEDRSLALLAAAITNVADSADRGLERLRLAAVALPPAFLAALAETEALRGLTELALVRGTLGDEHLPALRALLAGAPGLRRLELTYNYLSSEAVAELQRLAPGRVSAARQKPDGSRQLPVFGRYGFPDAGEF